MNERRYSLRTCAIIVAIGIALSWAPIIGLWLWLKPAGGLIIASAMPPKKYWAEECTVTVKITNADRARFLCKLMKANEGALACGTVGGDFMVVPSFGTANMSLAEYGVTFLHEQAHPCKSYPADHPR